MATSSSRNMKAYRSEKPDAKPSGGSNTDKHKSPLIETTGKAGKSGAVK